MISKQKTKQTIVRWLAVLACVILGSTISSAFAQQRGQQPPQPPESAQESAQVDLTGYWVPLVTEDWLWRMVTPPKGNYASVPLNPEGRRVADTWDLEKDIANGDQCKPFGAGGVMRMPLRVHITWADDNTLKIETDAGQQTRLFHFDETAQPSPQRTWQGFSLAEWTRPLPRRGRGRRGGPPVAAAPPEGALKVVTNNLRAGYLRKNGVPYSENAVVTEYYDRVSAFGNDYMMVVTVVEDPTYLTMPFITSTNFKREPDGSKWNPSPCKIDPPVAPSEPEAGR